MKTLNYSFVIPVFNRPDEIKELLESFTNLEGSEDFEIVIVEDGSTDSSKSVVEAFSKDLNISYYQKNNSGPGDSRNYGMRRATGNYYIILDSDCLLPKHYLMVVNDALTKVFVDCFGGPDAAHSSFSNLQKAINFAMTSFLTTGGIRGGMETSGKFQPRSFNMGLSKAAFETSGGFGAIHPGEDPDLSIRLNKLGFKTRLIKDAFVYHKRRVSWSKFYAQVYKFGKVRPILNSWHPETARITYWFPSVFSIGFLLALVISALGNGWLLFAYGLYFLAAFLMALMQSKNLVVAIQALLAVCIQFFGYGLGFIGSTIAIKILGKKPEQFYPKLFFKHVE